MKTLAEIIRYMVTGLMLFSCMLYCVTAMAWPADLLKWATIVAEGSAKHPKTYQKALAITFKYNKSINRMAMLTVEKGGIPAPIYQANQRVFAKINRELTAKAARDAGLIAKLQVSKPGSGAELFKSGTDTDVIVETGTKGKKITLKDIRKAEQAYEHRVKEFLKKRSVDPSGKIDTDTDFMPNSKDTTPSEFKKINKYINKNGGTAYESPAAAEVEAKLRTPGSNLGVAETGEYVAEMQKLAGKKLKYADTLDDQLVKLLPKKPAGMSTSEWMKKLNKLSSSNPAITHLQAEAQLARSQVGKYIARIDEATRKLATQHGIEIPPAKNPFWKAVEKVNKARGTGSTIEAANMGALGKYGTDKALTSYAETLAKIASKGGAELGDTSRQIAESISHLPPSAQGQFIESLKASAGDDVARAVNGELRQLNEASRIAAQKAIWKTKLTKGLKVLGTIMIVHDGYGRIKAAWNAKPEDKPQVAMEEGGSFVAGTAGAIGGGFLGGAAMGALMGSWFPVAGPIIGGVVGGVTGYLVGNYVGKEAGRKAATLLGVNQKAYLPVILEAAQGLHNGLIRRGVPPKEALAVARAFLNGPKKEYNKLMAKIRRMYGKNKGYVSVRHSQKDWYCTNRPVIESKVKMPDMIREEINGHNKN